MSSSVQEAAVDPRSAAASSLRGNIDALVGVVGAGPSYAHIPADSLLLIAQPLIGFQRALVRSFTAGREQMAVEDGDIDVGADSFVFGRNRRGSGSVDVRRVTGGGDLIDAIKSVHEGKTFFSPEITKMLMDDYVVELKSNKEIAQVLNLSLYTVETHRRNLHELILYAVRKGVIS